MKKIELIKCDDCGEYFTPGNRPDGLPNGIGFVLQDGTIRNICADCIIKKGGGSEEKTERAMRNTTQSRAFAKGTATEMLWHWLQHFGKKN